MCPIFDPEIEVDLNLKKANAYILDLYQMFSKKIGTDMRPKDDEDCVKVLNVLT